MTSNEYEFYTNEDSSSIKNFFNYKQCLATGIVLGTTLTATTLVNPKIRKIAIPTYKYLAKQQLKILAGVGLFSIASVLTSKSNDF